MLFPSSPQLPSPCICYILTTLKQQKTFINNISCKEDTDILVNISVTDVLVHLKSNIQQSSDDILYCNITKKYVILNLFLFIIDPQGHSNSTFSILLLLLNTIFFRVWEFHHLKWKWSLPKPVVEHYIHSQDERILTIIQPNLISRICNMPKSAWLVSGRQDPSPGFWIISCNKHTYTMTVAAAAFLVRILWFLLNKKA